MKIMKDLHEMEKRVDERKKGEFCAFYNVNARNL
jgi:hypothetical protein